MDPGKPKRPRKKDNSDGMRRYVLLKQHKAQDASRRIGLLQQQKVNQEQLLLAITQEFELLENNKDEKQQIIANLETQYSETFQNIRKINKEIKRLQEKYL